MALSDRKKQILDILLEHPESNISSLQKLLPDQPSIPTLNRDLKRLVEAGFLIKTGGGRSIAYQLAPGYLLVNSGIGDSYFNKEVDERKGKKSIDPELFAHLEAISIFSSEELSYLDNLQQEHFKKISTLSEELKRKETNRLSIELSWKSSQIEGNTYSLLETEVLLSENIPVEGKERSEATMLINHKLAMDYLYEGRISLVPIHVAAIENIHSVLIRDLGVSRNIRKRVVGITGTTYSPPDNEFQIREYLEQACHVINNRNNVFEKALLAVLFISYIQPFEDGNKRTGRITGNGILIENGYCPLSYRSVKTIDYKKAMILFYEQNNISAYKKLFMEQFEFAVKNYYR